MIFNRSLKIASVALRKNKMRTGLALLGMTIGVAAVLTMFALGTGAQKNVSSEVRSAGTTLLFVRAGNYTRGGEELKIASGLGSANTLTPDDAAAVAGVSGVAHASGLVRIRSWVDRGTDREFTQIYGVDVDYPKMFDWTFEKGRFFKKGIRRRRRKRSGHRLHPPRPALPRREPRRPANPDPRHPLHRQRLVLVERRRPGRHGRRPLHRPPEAHQLPQSHPDHRRRRAGRRRVPDRERHRPASALPPQSGPEAKATHPPPDSAWAACRAQAPEAAYPTTSPSKRRPPKPSPRASTPPSPPLSSPTCRRWTRSTCRRCPVRSAAPDRP